MQMKRRGVIKVKLGKDQNKTSLQQATRHEEPGLIFTWGLCIAESTNFPKLMESHWWRWHIHAENMAKTQSGVEVVVVMC